MKRFISFLLPLVLLMSLFGTPAFAGDLDENGETGGSGPSGSGQLNGYWSGSWCGMRITVIDVSDPAREIDGEQWGKVAEGTVSVDITGLDSSNGFFTRTLAGDGSTALAHGNKVTHFGKVSKMDYRDGAALAVITGGYEFYTVSGCPAVMGSNQASTKTIKDFINNQGMLTNIAQWCGGGLTYEALISGKYKLLVEPIMYVLIYEYKYAFTATEAAMYKPYGDSLWTIINNTLANAFFLEQDELGWDKWTGSTTEKQSFSDIISYLGMHIYSIAPTDAPPPTPPKSLKIIKKSDAGASLSGAQFKIEGNGKNETVTVNGTLTHSLDGWTDGSYTVTEVTAPSGYELNATPQTFTISSGNVSPAELTFINTKTPPPPPPETPPPTEVDFKKVEWGTEKGLAGAVFKVTQLSHWETRLVDPNGDDTGEFYVDDNGDVLNAGDPGYHHNVVDLADDIWVWLEIRETKDVGTFVSGSDGSIPVGALEAGSYTIEELSPPAGYVLAETLHERIQSFDVPRESGYTPKITFTNKKLPGLTVIKVDEDTGLPLAGAEFSIAHKNSLYTYEAVTDASGTINLEGLPEGWYTVTELAAPHGYLKRDESKDVYLPAGGSAQIKFDNRRRPTLEIIKLDEQTKQPLSGAKFRVWNTEGATVGEYTTGSDGKVTIENLDEAIYSVEEISAPDGYLLDPQHKDVKLEWGKVTSVVFTNRLKPGLTITKVDEQTGERLADAHFRVESLDQSGFYYEGVTDRNGQIHLTDLPEGVYEIKETTPPDGYIIVNHPKQVQLIGDSVVNVIFTNLKKPTLTITKYDELTNRPLAGASFRLWKTEGETWSETQITDANGRITWTGLDPGIYSIQEIDEPYGYFKDPARKEILLEGGDNKFLEFFNRPRPVLTILKRDAITGEPLAGVKFKVQRLEGETIGEFLTDANGMIELSPKTGYLLEEKIYRVTEITPPNEYLLSDNPTKDVLLKWYEPTELVFENLLKPTLIFIKRDGMSGRGISGATYRVQYESATGGVTTLGSYVTKCGLIVLPYVTPGWYVLTETSPAPGYSLPTNPTQRFYLAPGENSYTYAQTQADLYIDPRTNPNSGKAGVCGECCGFLCSVLCADNCGNPGGGSMDGGTGGSFGNLTITNGNGDPLTGGTTQPTNPVTPPSDPSKPTLTAGTVTRISDLTATIQFTSSVAGRYYYSAVNSGANEPTVATGGLGTVCTAGINTITVYMTAGVKDLYIKVKDADGNVSDALKITIPAYSATQTQTQTPEQTPNFDDIVITGGTVVYLNPDFSTVVIKFGSY